MRAGDAGHVDQRDRAEAGERARAGRRATDPFGDIEGLVDLVRECRAALTTACVVRHHDVDLDPDFAQCQHEPAGGLGQPADPDQGSQFGRGEEHAHARTLPTGGEVSR